MVQASGHVAGPSIPGSATGESRSQGVCIMGDTIHRQPANHVRSGLRAMLLGLALMGSAYANEAPPPPTPTPVEVPAPVAREEDRGDLSVALRKERDARKVEAERASGLQAQLDAIKAERAKAREDDMAKQGEYKTLLDESKASLATLQAEREAIAAERDALKAAATEREAKLIERNTADMEALPEKAKAFVEKFGTDAKPDRVREMIDEARALFGGAPAPKHAGAGRVAGGELVPNPDALTAEMTAWFEANRPTMLNGGASEKNLRAYYEKHARGAATT